jgi:TonB family protein
MAPPGGMAGLIPRTGSIGSPGITHEHGDPPVVDFREYMADLERRIRRAWVPPRLPYSKQVVLIFSISTSGELSNLRLSKSSGVSEVDEAALKAVQNAAPFRQLPKGADDKVDIQFTFDYNVFGSSSSRIRF